jgi:Tfp pilus assembly protein PilP
VKLLIYFFILLFQSLNTFAQAPVTGASPTPEAQALQLPAPAIQNSPIPGEAVTIGEGLSKRDPFKLPEYIIIKIRQKLATSLIQPGGIDESVEAIRRWPVPTYQLVGIIWDVKKPKAMFLDRNNSIHVLNVNDFIGNAKGVVTSIQSGSVTILEGRIPQIIKLKK